MTADEDASDSVWLALADEIVSQFDDDLALVERKLSEGVALMARQRELVAKMREQGLDSSELENLLMRSEDILAQHKVSFDLLKGQQRLMRSTLGRMSRK